LPLGGEQHCDAVRINPVEEVGDLHMRELGEIAKSVGGEPVDVEAVPRGHAISLVADRLRLR